MSDLNTTTPEMNEYLIKRRFLDRYIVPNFYTQEDLGIEDWSESKVERFKEFVKEQDWFYDQLNENYQMLIGDFKDKDDDATEDQDDFEDRMCELCDNQFTLKDPHYYDEENAICYCSEDCFKADQEPPEDDCN
jgi:hypothetical protein